MKSIIPTYITNVGFCFIMLLCTSMLAVQIQISAARTFHASCLNKIQASNFNHSVVEQCQQKATDRGYTLEEPKQVSVYQGKRSYVITLDYSVSVPFLGIGGVPGTVSGYAK